MPGAAARAVAVTHSLAYRYSFGHPIAYRYSFGHPIAYRYSFGQRVFGDRGGEFVITCPDWLVHGDRLGVLNHGDRLGLGVLGHHDHDIS